MIHQIKTIFFGSTTDSVLVFDELLKESQSNLPLLIAAVVTQPSTPHGRHQIVTETPVSLWAKKHNLTTLEFKVSSEKHWLYENEQSVIDTLSTFKADLLISACYGQKIPANLIKSARLGGLNIHPSVLPRWRGADPVPWAIIAGDQQTGVTIVTLDENFDDGLIINQKKISLKPEYLPDPLRTELFLEGTKLLVKSINDLKKETKIKGKPQDHKKSSYARRLTRNDGYIKWEYLNKAITGDNLTPTEYSNLNLAGTLSKYIKSIYLENSPLFFERMIRALTPWPGVWTDIQIMAKDKHTAETKRLKILKAHLVRNEDHQALTKDNYKLVIDGVQLEGKNPVSFAQFKSAYFQNNFT